MRHPSNSLSMGDYNWSCFAAQQATEKALKAVILLEARRRSPRGHDLVTLYSQLRGRLKFPRRVKEGLAELSAFYTLARYPNAGLERPSTEINKAQAGRALRIAQEVLGHAEKRFETSIKG